MMMMSFVLSSLYFVGCDVYQAIVALSEDVDIPAVLDTIKSCDGAEVFNTDSLCHIRYVMLHLYAEFNYLHAFLMAWSLWL